MKERPIIFSGDMVRAILAGTKTQTRRVIKPQPYRVHLPAIYCKRKGQYGLDACPYGVPGDRLWVRETWRDDSYDCEWGTRMQYSYRADFPHGDGGGNWRPSIHMPRHASRILLEITGVRAEHLQDITNEDCYAEGITQEQANEQWYDGPHPESVFANLWDSLNAKRGYGWDVNPWVWVIEFKPLALGAGK